MGTAPLEGLAVMRLPRVGISLREMKSLSPSVRAKLLSFRRYAFDALAAVGFMFLCAGSPAARAAESEPQAVAVVVGAPGLPEYGEQFVAWTNRWRQAAGRAGASYFDVGRDEGAQATDRQQLEQFLGEQTADAQSRLWLILIGHGTFYRDTANFNLRGPDVSSKELAEWLNGVRRPVVIVNCASSSGPFIRDLAAPGRVVVTATQSGAEQNYARFGDYFSQAMDDPSADLDHDKQVSLLEAYLSASGQVAQFYEDEARLATEHALIDDNGDGLGTPATFFRGVRAVRAAQNDAPLDGRLAARIVLVPSDTDRGFSAEQLQERAMIEQEMDRLRDQKASMLEDEYYTKLEPLLVRLARLYDDAESAGEINQEGEAPAPQEGPHE
jgi:hypothetical protein